MARSIASELGHVAPLILDEVARRSRTYTGKGFARYLGVDPGLVSRWRSGERGMPVEVLPHLARYVGDPEAVYGDLLARAGYRMVLDDIDQVDDDLDHVARSLRLAMGQVLVALARARDPDGPGGADLTSDERTELRDLARELRGTARQLEMVLEER